MYAAIIDNLRAENVVSFMREQSNHTLREGNISQMSHMQGLIGIGGRILDNYKWSILPRKRRCLLGILENGHVVGVGINERIHVGSHGRELLEIRSGMQTSHQMKGELRGVLPFRHELENRKRKIPFIHGRRSGH